MANSVNASTRPVIVKKTSMAGKSNPVVIYDLVCLLEEANEKQITLCGLFSEALNAYKTQLWEEAMKRFNETIKLYGKDGPPSYYLGLCEKLKMSPPREMWDGVIHMDKK